MSFFHFSSRDDKFQVLPLLLLSQMMSQLNSTEEDWRRRLTRKTDEEGWKTTKSSLLPMMSETRGWQHPVQESYLVCLLRRRWKEMAKLTERTLNLCPELTRDQNWEYTTTQYRRTNIESDRQEKKGLDSQRQFSLLILLKRSDTRWQPRRQKRFSSSSTFQSVQSDDNDSWLSCQTLLCLPRLNSLNFYSNSTAQFFRLQSTLLQRKRRFFVLKSILTFIVSGKCCRFWLHIFHFRTSQSCFFRNQVECLNVWTRLVAVMHEQCPPDLGDHFVCHSCQRKHKWELLHVVHEGAGWVSHGKQGRFVIQSQEDMSDIRHPDVFRTTLGPNDL